MKDRYLKINQYQIYQTFIKRKVCTDNGDYKNFVLIKESEIKNGVDVKV